MTPKECANAWKEIIRVYKDTIEESPQFTVNKIIENLGFDKTKEVFATVAAIKKHDGRIYGKNRKYMESIQVNSDAVEWKYGNPMVSAGIDDIHTAHINQLITELRMRDKMA